MHADNVLCLLKGEEALTNEVAGSLMKIPVPVKLAPIGLATEFNGRVEAEVPSKKKRLAVSCADDGPAVLT